MICEVNLGMGHLARMLTIGRTLAHSFRVALVLVSSEVLHVAAPEGVAIHWLLRPRPPILSGHRTVTEGLIGIANELNPAVILIEFFPFARHASVFYLLPFLNKIRSLAPVHVLCSLRDIQDHIPEALNSESVTQLANRHFDAILVHSDPRWTRLEDTFPAVDRIDIPIIYTNYVSRHEYSAEAGTGRSKTILLSAGGGRGGEALLDCAIAAAKEGLLGEYKLRVLAGKLLLEPDWRSLVAACADAGEFIELLRWAPDLFAELRQAAVSVSRFGYNTAMDLLAARVPSLVVPYTTPEADEQLRRAILFSGLGLLRMLREEDMTPAVLAAEIHQTVGFKSVRQDARLDGAEQTCRIISDMVSAARIPSTAMQVLS